MSPPGAPPPMQPWGPAAPPMPPQRSRRNVAAIARLAMIGFVVLLAVPTMLAGFWFARKQTRPHVMFENPTSAPVDIAVDGRSIGSVAAAAGKVVELAPGAHAIVAGADKATVTVPDQVGYRGVFSVGGRSALAAVTVFYSTAGKGSHEDRIEPVVFAKGERLAALPFSMTVDAMDIDKPFAATIQIPQGSTETSVTHLCHLKGEDDVGCPGF